MFLDYFGEEFVLSRFKMSIDVFNLKKDSLIVCMKKTYIFQLYDKPIYFELVDEFCCVSCKK